MDARKIVDILRATIHPDPAQRQQGEEQLAQMHKIIGFAPSLLQVVMMNDVRVPVRQAGVVYLKNMVTSGWQEKEKEEGEVIPFHIHEQDRGMIRDIIVDATVQAEGVIRVQLCVCLKTIIKHDFPSRWTQVVDKIHIYLQNPEPSNWMGALQCLYQLIKIYEYQMAEKRLPLIEAMNLLLPMMYNLIVNLQVDQSAESVLIQKQILKCFSALIMYILPLDLLTNEVFTKWMEVLRAIMEQPVPEHTLQIDEDERQELPWWKCKKWAMRILYRFFERYGSPVNSNECYVPFAEWYITTFTGGVLEVLLRILDQYRNKIYVSPRVLQKTLSYLDQCIIHAHSWKLLKPHMFAIIQDVLFPLMCHSDADESLWYSDTHEYIRLKFDILEDIISPVPAGQSLLISCCKKRKDMLERTMQLCMRVLTSRNGEYGPRQKDGALHMVGTLNFILIKKKCYKDEIDSLLNQYVFPEFSSEFGFLRARACWVLHCFAVVRFKNDMLLMEAVRLVVNLLLNDTELPVKIEAATSIQVLLKSQEKVQKYLEPQIAAITTNLLKVIREIENDSITSVLQTIVPLYTDGLMPIAYEITEHLATTFSIVIESDSGESDEKALTAMCLLNTMETILNVMENNPTIMAQLEKTVLRVVGHILHHNIIEYYEEAMTLLCTLTSKTISEDMWKVLEVLYQVFEKDGYDYFTDMMPILHNYITVDTDAFVSNVNHILAMFNMAKIVLNSEAEDETYIHAAKLLEVMVLQCAGKIDNCLPTFVELVLNCLTRKVKTPELRTMLLQVLIAILYTNGPLFFSILDKLQENVPNASITQHFIKQWIHDLDCFSGLHDRKLCVLGICALLEMGPQGSITDEVVPKIIPSCLQLFDGLKRAYEIRAEADDDDSSSEEDEEEDEEVLSSDEDDLDEANNEYLENLARMAVKNSAQQGVQMSAALDDLSDDDDDDFDPIETQIECYTTPLDETDCPVDEYIKFKNTLLALSNGEPAFYHALTGVLNEEQQKHLNAVYVLADQRKAQQDSKRIEQSGGYSFSVPAQVPTKFKFGS